MALTLIVDFEGDQATKSAPDEWLPVLQSFLGQVNSERTSRGEAGYANLAEYFVDRLADAVKSYKENQDELSALLRKAAYDAAPQVDKDQIDAILGI
jgi:cytochrome P450